MHIFLFAAALMTSIAPVQGSAPNRQPQMAATGAVTAVVFGSGPSIWFSASHDAGVSFGAPVEVARVPVLALGRHRGPRVTVAGDVFVVTAVVGQVAATGPHAHGLSSDGNLLAWRSVDGGRSWSEPVVINDAAGSAREGLHSVAVSPTGELAAVWLDLRSTGTMLYGAFSSNHGASWSKNVLLYKSPGGTMCQCCHPSLVFTGPQRAEVMLRDAMDGNRNMKMLAWQIGGEVSKPEKLGNGSWHLEACPMDGGGIAYRDGITLTAWRREDTVYLDRPGEPETPLGIGKDVSLVLTPEGPQAIWTGPSGIEYWRSDEAKPITLATSGAFPTLVSQPDGSTLSAWEAPDGSITLERLPDHSENPPAVRATY